MHSYCVKRYTIFVKKISIRIGGNSVLEPLYSMEEA